MGNSTIVYHYQNKERKVRPTKNEEKEQRII